MVSQTELRNDPRVLAALAEVSKTAAEQYRPRNLERELRDAIDADTGEHKPEMPEAWMRKFTYFRDYVVPEMARPNRDGEQTCFGCHGR